MLLYCSFFYCRLKHKSESSARSWQAAEAQARRSPPIPCPQFLCEPESLRVRSGHTRTVWLFLRAQPGPHTLHARCGFAQFTGEDGARGSPVLARSPPLASPGLRPGAPAPGGSAALSAVLGDGRCVVHRVCLIKVSGTESTLTISGQQSFGIFFPKGISLGFTGMSEGTFDIYDPLLVWAELTPRQLGFWTQPGELRRCEERGSVCGHWPCVLPSGPGCTLASLALDLPGRSAQPV